MKSLLVGANVVIAISDPWEVASINEGIHRGQIVEIDKGSFTRPILKIQLNQIIEFGTIQARIIFACFRHSDGDILQLQSYKPVSFNFTSRVISVKSEINEGENLAFIGTMQLVI